MAAFDPTNIPMHVALPAFNRIEGSRCAYTIEVYFEGQHPWRLEKTYTELHQLKTELEVSQYSALAKDFPPKHPVGLSFKMKFQFKQNAMKSEVEFLKDRLSRIEKFLNDLLAVAGPDGVDEVVFLNRFFNAFNEKKSGVAGHADLDKSMLHTLKGCRIPKTVYRQLWEQGFTLDTLHTIERDKWASLGVAPGCIEQLEVKLGGLRHMVSQTIIGANGQVTSVMTDPVTGALRGSMSQGAPGLGRTISQGSMASMQPPMGMQQGMQQGGMQGGMQQEYGGMQGMPPPNYAYGQGGNPGMNGMQPGVRYSSYG